MLILGIDPGTARLGYGLIRNGKADALTFVDAGCLETSLETPMPERLLYLQGEIGKILAKHKPDVLAIEALFFGINAKTAIAVGQARGVVLAEAARYKIPVFEYQGLSVKFAITGFGRAKKKEIQEGVRQILKMDKIIKPDDAADGLAIAITHHIKQSMKRQAESVKKKTKH
ncbi:crossover junction endodeoxyribonuclease RuvC [Patescibacteria group bacterium]|nr:crossover junction endodeoxyribonuclease RuvC [Patescibacteria group bacterium]